MNPNSHKDHLGSSALTAESLAEASKPVRVQLSRAKGWRMPPNTVKVSRPGPWGNPFTVADGYTAKQAVQRFREMLSNHAPPLHELRGKNLACWCKPGTPCHADVLLEMANAPSGVKGADQQPMKDSPP